MAILNPLRKRSAAFMREPRQESLARLLAMWPDAARDQPKSSNEQHKHHNGIEKAGWAKKDVQVGKDAREDE